MANSLKTEDYVVSVAKSLGMTKKDTRNVIKEFLSQIADNTAAGRESQFVGLGKIVIREVQGGTRRNPRTGEPVTVEAHQKPKFHFSGKVSDALRGHEA